MNRRLVGLARTNDAGVSGFASDVIGSDAGDNPSPPYGSGTGRLLVLGCAFLLGFGFSHVLDDERRSALARSPEGQLSLALDAAEGPDHVRDREGRLSVRLSFVVRNTGPVDVVLHSAGLGDLTAPDIAGRPVLASGITRISLTRRIDCTSPTRGAAPAGSLVVEATTPAGARTTSLPLDDELLGRFDERLRQACGQVPPQAALELETSGLLADAGGRGSGGAAGRPSVLLHEPGRQAALVPHVPTALSCPLANQGAFTLQLASTRSLRLRGALTGRAPTSGSPGGLSQRCG